MKTKTRFHKLSAWLLAIVMVVGMLPASLVTVVQAADSSEKGEMSRSDYEALGFDIGLETTDESYIGPGNTTMNVRNELYLNYNGSSHYGWVLRDNLNLDHSSWSSYETIGAYKLYGQYRNGDWAHLNEGNGYTYGQTGGEDSVIGSRIKSSNSHQLRTYETSVSFRSASGKEDRVAQLYVKSSDNRVDYKACLEIVRFVESNGKYTESVVRSVTLGNIPALDEAGKIYNPIFDALFDVTAGDFDGDGIDEIAVYYGTNEVKIYDTGSKGDSLSLWKTIGASEILKDQNISAKKSADSTDGGVMRAAVVALAAGDLKKDYSDDLVITVSMPVDNDGSCLNAHQQNPHAYVYGANSSDSYVSSGEFTKDLEVPLRTDDLQGDTNKPQVFRAANATVADIDGNACMDLLIGGRLGAASETNGEDWSVGALIHVKYDHGSRNYSVGKPFQNELKEYDGDNVLRNGSSSAIRYFPPVALAVADLDGVGSDAPTCLFFAELFTFDPETRSFTGTGKYLDTIKNQKNNADEGEDKTDHWVSDVVVGNFIDDPNGSEQFIAIVACKQDNDDWYWYYMSYVAKYGDTICAQCEGIINQARSYINKTDTSRASVYVSVACPDVDNDSVLMEYVGTSSYYTKPEVQAVLQSAPYFADVADTHDNYLNNGSTAYGKVEGTMEGTTVSVGASLGMFTSAEVSFGAAAEVEFDISVTTDYEHMTSTEVETSVERSGDAGDDYVIMYTIPYHRYYYNATWPDGTKSLFTIEEPLTPATVIVPVETYDAIAEKTEGLEPIRGNILTSTPGDPSSYTMAPKGKWTAIGDVQLLTNAGSNSGSLTTVSQTASNSTENSFAVGVEQNLEVGFGGGGLGNDVVVGVQQGSHFSAGGVYSDMSGATYTGAVDNLPSGVTGYAFNWQFGISNTKLNGEDVIVVGYVTSNVKQAPSVPKELTVTDITDDSVSLEWKAGNDAAMFEVYVSRDQDTWLPLDPISATMADSDGKISYTVGELNAGTTYYFRVVSANAFGVRSLETAPVVGTTLGSDGTFSIAGQPKDTSAAKGLDATFSTEIVSDSNKTIFYEWQYNDGDGWKKISGSNTSALTVEAVTGEMDGRQYRCRVSQGADYVYTRTATLTVSKTPTSATLAIANGAESVTNGDTVQATSSVSEDIVETIMEWHSVTTTNGGKTYSMMATSEEATTDANGVVTDYAYTTPYFWVDESGKLYAVDAGNAVGAEYTDAYRVFRDKKDDGTQGDLNVEASATLTTGLTEEEVATGVKSTSGYKVGDTYVYVAEVTVDTDSEDSTATKYYYKSGDAYVEVFHDESADYIMADGEKCKPNSLVPVQTFTSSQVVTGQNDTTVDGDKLTLTASVAPAEITGSVYFQITDLTTGSTQTVNAKKSGDKWTAEHTFASSGVYEVRSAYGGSNVYFGSNSEPIKIYAISAGKSLAISGGTMTYGSALNLAPIIVSKDGKSPVTSENAVTYTVKKDGNEVSGLVSRNMFTPAEIGNYTVTAKYNDGTQDYTTTVAIKVHPKTVQIAAQPAKASLRDDKATREAQLSATVTGITPADAHLLKYSLTSDATTANTKGDYRIEVKVDSDARAELEKKFSLVLSSSVYTLEQGSVRVYAEGVSNGTVGITYTTTVSDSNGTYTSTPLKVESGTLLPIGAAVTITAAPNTGFGVEKWVIDGAEILSGDLSYTIDNLQEACNIKVYFTQTFNTLSFGGTPGGAVTGTYAGGNSAFNSGDSINLNQSVVLTAVPYDNYVVAGWTRNGETVLAEDGVSNFTGSELTVSHVNESINYFLTFEQKTDADVIVKFVDKDGASVAGCGVNINQQNVDGTGNIFTLNTHKHANLDIKVTVPDNMLIDHWELDGQIAANAVDELTVYDLTGSAEYTVICVTPNQRGLTFGTELIGTNGGTVADAGTITAIRSGSAITSGDNVPQGAVVSFTAQAAEGYRVAKWTVGAYQVAGEGVESYQLTMDQNAEVKVHFEKKPTIVLDNGSGGNANLQVGSVTSTDAETVVDFGSNVQVNIVPTAGYVVDTVTFTADGQTRNAELAADKDIRYATLDNVTHNTTVAVTYKPKPVVTVDSGANGTVTISATKDFTEGAISSGSYVDFDSDVEVEVSPVKGYVIETVTVNGDNASLTEIANSDNKSFTVYNVQENTAIAVTYKALDTVSVTFGVVDKNDDEAGGLNGALSATVERKGMEDYAAADDTGTIATVYEGSTVTFAPVPEAGYKVSKWFVNGEETTQAPTITVADGMADQNILAQFDYVGEDISFSITGASDKASLTAVFVPDGGVAQDFASGNKPAVDGVVTITVNDLDNNYEIEGWYVNGEKQQSVDTAFDYAATVGVGADITVNVIRKSYTVDFSATEGTVTAVVSGNATASGDLVVGDSIVTFTAQPKGPTGYSFIGWTVNGIPSDETAQTLSLSVTENLTVEATYSLDAVTHQIIYGVVNTNGETDGGLNGILTLSGHSSSPASVYAGTDVSFTAVPDTYYRVEGWYSDAAGTMPISDTDVEQNTYNVANVMAPLTVYVKFEPIPKYTISIATTGLGTVTATVNGEATTIENGSITVWRYDDVVLTAVPDAHQYLSGWTVDQTDSGNQLSLTLTDVTENTDVTAEFMASQNIELKTEVVNGTIEIRAGFGEQMEYINPETGIVIHRGQNVELTVTPDSNMMVDKWIVNGEERTDYLDNTLLIEAIDKDTTIRVECVQLALHNLPADDAQNRYVVTDILETPVEYGTDKQVRDRGTVTFVVESKDNNVITELQVAAGTGSKIDARKTAVNKWNVTVENVKADIVLTPTIVFGKQLEVTCGTGGKIVITKNGEIIANDSVLNFGDEIVIQAEADKNYKFATLTLNGNAINSGDTYTVVPEDEHIRIEAAFTARTSGGTGGGGGGGGTVSTYTVKFETNGGSEIKDVSVSRGGKVTKPDTPTKDGYTFDGWYTDKELTVAYDFDATVVKSLTLYAKWKELGGNLPFGWQNPFEDVKAENWFYDDVRFVNENGLMKGVSEKLFAPNGNVTRAMLVTVLYRNEGEPAINRSIPFADVDLGAYYGSAVIWAKQNGIVNGVSETEFAPDDNITREQIAAIMHRYAQYKGYDVSVGENTNILSYDDFDSISEYAIASMQWAVGSGMIKGRTESTLNPLDNATRAEIAAILHRFIEANK